MIHTVLALVLLVGALILVGVFLFWLATFTPPGVERDDDDENENA